jgi:hypothetical protein
MTGLYKVVGRDFYKAAGYSHTLSQIRNLTNIINFQTSPPAKQGHSK